MRSLMIAVGPYYIFIARPLSVIGKEFQTIGQYCKFLSQPLATNSDSFTSLALYKFIYLLYFIYLPFARRLQGAGGVTEAVECWCHSTPDTSNNHT